jgi:hypothetical protein
MRKMLLSATLNVIGAIVVIAYLLGSLTARMAFAITAGDEPLFLP